MEVLSWAYLSPITTYLGLFYSMNVFLNRDTYLLFVSYSFLFSFLNHFQVGINVPVTVPLPSSFNGLKPTSAVDQVLFQFNFSSS